jgi:hypothetical protein
VPLLPAHGHDRASFVDLRIKKCLPIQVIETERQLSALKVDADPAALPDNDRSCSIGMVDSPGIPKAWVRRTDEFERVWFLCNRLKTRDSFVGGLSPA